MSSPRGTLTALAISAPDRPVGAYGYGVLDSADPVSLFNACRLAAHLSSSGVGPWGHSNWATGRERRRAFILCRTEQCIESLRAVFESVRPNLVLIGAMTQCLPGAVACARAAKAALGDEVCVVLGGWHATESMYDDPQRGIRHHPSSPLRLIAEGLIPPVFDVVISGPGHTAIAGIGEMVATRPAHVSPAECVPRDLARLGRYPGPWVAGVLRHGHIRAISGVGSESVGGLPTCATLFGVGASFSVFGGRPTAHVFSDSGRGCIYDCSFCSERRSLTGGATDLGGAAQRLFGQLADAARAIEQTGRRASAFVEDSTLLGGSPAGMRQLADLLANARLDLRFGAQLTVDQVLQRRELLAELRPLGLTYLFVGIETPRPESIGGMSKDVSRGRIKWLERSKHAIELLSDLRIQCGGAILFGLGESQPEREAFLQQLSQWKQACGSPQPLSLNWAVQHPLRGADGDCNYRYAEWGLPDAEWAHAFRHFGEASVRYPLAGVAPPRIEDVHAVSALYETLWPLEDTSCGE